MGRLPDNPRDEDTVQDRFQWEHIAAQIAREAKAFGRPYEDLMYAIWDELDKHGQDYA